MSLGFIILCAVVALVVYLTYQSRDFRFRREMAALRQIGRETEQSIRDHDKAVAKDQKRIAKEWKKQTQPYGLLLKSELEASYFASKSPPMLPELLSQITAYATAAYDDTESVILATEPKQAWADFRQLQKTWLERVEGFHSSLPAAFLTDPDRSTNSPFQRTVHLSQLPDFETFQRKWRLYLRDIEFYDYKITLSIKINPARWFEGTWVVAPQGRGKTNLLRHLILHHLPDACVIIMDPKGDLINSFQRHAPIKDRLVFLYPDAQHPLAINPLDIGGHSGEFLEYIFSVLNTEMTTNQTTLLSLVLTLCTLIPDANLETFRDILQNGWKQHEQYVRQLKKRDQDFFDKEWDNPLYKSRRPEVLGRLRTLMATPALDEILQSTETKVDLGKMMDDGKVILIDNNYERLGDKGAEFFGRMFIALVWAAARRRSLRTDKGKPVFFFIDEAHWTIANDTKVKTIIQQCRSQKIAMVFAHQEVEQVKMNTPLLGALNNCAIKFAKPNAPDEMAALAKALWTTPEFLKEQTQSNFSLHVLDQTKTAISVEVPYVGNPDATLIGYPRMTDAEFTTVLQRSRWDYCSGATGPRPGQASESKDDSFYDYEWSITISPRLAATGGKVREHGYNINIPAGVKHGEVLSLKGIGRQKPDGTYGHAYITLNIPQRADQQTFGLGPPDETDAKPW